MSALMPDRNRMPERIATRIFVVLFVIRLMRYNVYRGSPGLRDSVRDLRAVQLFAAAKSFRTSPQIIRHVTIASGVRHALAAFDGFDRFSKAIIFGQRGCKSTQHDRILAARSNGALR